MRLMSKPSRTEARLATWPSSAPNTASGAAICGGSAQAHTLIATSEKAKPETPWTKPARPRPAPTAPIVEPGSGIVAPRSRRRAARQRGLPDRAQRRRRRDRFRVDLDVHDRGLARRQARARRRARIRCGLLDRLAEAAEGAGVGGEIGIAQLRWRLMRPGYSRSWCMRMVPYRPLSTTIDDDRQAVLHGGGELLAVHQEVAVAGERDRRCARDRAAWRRPRPGTPKPIEPEIGPSCWSKRRKRRKRPGQMAKLPAPLAKIASGAASRNAQHDLAELHPSGHCRRLRRSRRDNSARASRVASLQGMAFGGCSAFERRGRTPAASRRCRGADDRRGRSPARRRGRGRASGAASGMSNSV